MMNWDLIVIAFIGTVVGATIGHILSEWWIKRIAEREAAEKIAAVRRRAEEWTCDSGKVMKMPINTREDRAAKYLALHSECVRRGQIVGEPKIPIPEYLSHIQRHARDNEITARSSK